MIERLDQIVGDPVPGRYYLVPHVFGTYHHYGRVIGPETRWWPVIGRLHTDAEFFDFDIPHYHLDQRFITLGSENIRSDLMVETAISAAPIQVGGARGTLNSNGLGRPQLRRRLCRRAGFDMGEFRACILSRLQRMEEAFPQAIKGKRGWICPHQKYDMTTVSPDADGNITCPMHGLKFCARTGAVVRSEERQPCVAGQTGEAGASPRTHGGPDGPAEGGEQ